MLKTVKPYCSRIGQFSAGWPLIQASGGTDLDASGLSRCLAYGTTRGPLLVSPTLLECTQRHR